MWSHLAEDESSNLFSPHGGPSGLFTRLPNPKGLQRIAPHDMTCVAATAPSGPSHQDASPHGPLPIAPSQRWPHSITAVLAKPPNGTHPSLTLWAHAHYSIAQRAAGADLQLVGCGGQQRNVCKAALSDHMFLTLDILCDSVNQIIDNIGPKVAREAETLLMFETVTRFTREWPELRSKLAFGLDGEPHADELGSLRSKTRRVFGLVSLVVLSPKNQEVYQVRWDEENTDGPYHDDLKFPFLLRLNTRTSRLTDQFQALDSRSSDEFLMQLALDEHTPWSCTQLRYTITEEKESLLYMTVHDTEDERQSVFDPATMRRMNIRKKGASNSTNKLLQLMNTLGATGGSKQRRSPAPKGAAAPADRAVDPTEQRRRRVARALGKRSVDTDDAGDPEVNSEALYDLFADGDLMEEMTRLDPDLVRQALSDLRGDGEDAHEPEPPPAPPGCGGHDSGGGGGAGDWLVDKTVNLFLNEADDPAVVDPEPVGGASASSGSGVVHKVGDAVGVASASASKPTPAAPKGKHAAKAKPKVKPTVANSPLLAMSQLP